MRKKKVLPRSVIDKSILLIGSLSRLDRAQVTTTGRISGIVIDQQGAVIHNADVTVRNNDTVAEYTAKSGEDGTFFISALPVTNYTVTVTASGFRQTNVTGVKIEVDRSATVEVRLEVGAASESVTVRAQVPPAHQSDVGSIISGRQITELPFTSRDAFNLVFDTSAPDDPVFEERAREELALHQSRWHQCARQFPEVFRMVCSRTSVLNAWSVGILSGAVMVTGRVGFLPLRL